jgi:hypothetical protein
MQLASKIILAGGQVVSATSNYSDLDVYAVKESSDDLELLVVNVNPAASLTQQFDLTGFKPAGPAEIWQYGVNQDNAQSHSATGASALADTNTNLSFSGSNFSYTFPAYSMTVLDLKPSFTIAVSPASPRLSAGQSQQFSAIALDQSGNPLPSQPAFTWSLIGNGNLTAGGLYTPSYASGTAVIEATQRNHERNDRRQLLRRSPVGFNGRRFVDNGRRLERRNLRQNACCSRATRHHRRYGIAGACSKHRRSGRRESESCGNHFQRR